MSDTTTHGLRVQVQSLYVEERSAPDDDYYFFAYRVRLSNVGDDVLKLDTRHWIITDANEHVEEVEGPGVIGEHPRLAPGESFEYTSFCPLATPVGTMHGSYHMVREDGTAFDAVIAPFRLAVPAVLN